MLYPAMATDLELLDAWAAGDKRAAKDLLERHFAALFRFFRNKVDDSVEDLVQDTMLACVKGRDRFRRDGSFRTYLFGTARHMLFGYYKKKRREVAIDFEVSSVVDLGPSPSEAKRRIPLDYQIVLELYHWEGLTGPQLAEVLEVSEAALRSRLHRAKLELRRQMEAVAVAPDVLESTSTNLDAGAESLRDEMSPR
jgi:DNA-directed RNA polymerase specialized sigma24 family protein